MCHNNNKPIIFPILGNLIIYIKTEKSYVKLEVSKFLNKSDELTLLMPGDVARIILHINSTIPSEIKTGMNYFILNDNRFLGYGVIIK